MMANISVDHTNINSSVNISTLINILGTGFFDPTETDPVPVVKARSHKSDRYKP